MLKICQEFICYELSDGSRTVKATPELDRAMAIARFGLSDAKALDTRLAQARALLELAEFAAGHEKATRMLDQFFRRGSRPAARSALR